MKSLPVLLDIPAFNFIQNNYNNSQIVPTGLPTFLAKPIFLIHSLIISYIYIHKYLIKGLNEKEIKSYRVTLKFLIIFYRI